MESQTLAGVTELAAPTEPRAFLVIHVDGGSRVYDLPEGVDFTFGRSRTATVMVDHDKVSRMHARVKRTGDAIEVEDLGSRNGTRVNGEKIEGVHRLVSGDEIAIGPIVAIVGNITPIRRSNTIADVTTGEQRLAAEVDRAVRYHRPVTIALVRVPSDDVMDAVARTLRPMDMIAEDAGDDYLVILPELGRSDGQAAIARLLELARASNVTAKAATVLCPDDGTKLDTLVGLLRGGLRTGAAPRPDLPPAHDVVIRDP
ncbi:MAG: FHA domain-containing protein, partial [Kofleriaceae bacterium]